MTTEAAVLLDANVLIAAHFEDHFHFAVADAWLKGRRFATTPSTQGSLLRYTLRVADPERAAALLNLLSNHPMHEFWPDDGPYLADMLVGVAGHRQLTDSYLAHVAASRAALLVTFDVGLKALRPNTVDLLRP